MKILIDYFVAVYGITEGEAISLLLSNDGELMEFIGLAYLGTNFYKGAFDL